MTVALQSALTKLPPAGGNIAGNPNRTYRTAITATASATALVLPNEGGVPTGGCYVTWVSTTDLYIHVAALVGARIADVTLDFFLPAGVEKDWWHEPGYSEYFSAIRSTADGVIMRYRSNR